METIIYSDFWGKCFLWKPRYLCVYPRCWESPLSKKWLVFVCVCWGGCSHPSKCGDRALGEILQRGIYFWPPGSLKSVCCCPRSFIGSSRSFPDGVPLGTDSPLSQLLLELPRAPSLSIFDLYLSDFCQSMLNDSRRQASSRGLMLQVHSKLSSEVFSVL